VLPTCPDAGESELIPGITVKVRLLLDTPPTFTTTGPVVVDAGTTAIILVVDQLLVVADIPLNVMVLVP
jgi:hypothetical protein